MRCLATLGSISLQRLSVFSQTAVKVHDSQAYRNMNMMRVHCFTFYSRDMLYLHISCSFVKSCIERTSSLGPSFVTTAPLKIVTVLCFSTLTPLHSERPKLYAILAFMSAIGLTFISFWIPLTLSLVCLSQYLSPLHFIPCAGFVEIFN